MKPTPRVHVWDASWLDVPGESVGSDSDDIAAIQTYLANTSSQVSAAVEKLDEATKGRWYLLAKRIAAYVAEPVAMLLTGDQLTRGQGLRTELNAFVARLPKDVANAVTSAPAPHEAPPPVGTPNPILSVLDSKNLLPLAFLGLVALALMQKEGGRRAYG